MTAPESLADDLRRDRVPFAIATVIRTVGATAAKPGARAVILADGTIRDGWVGGGCVRSAIGRAATEALRTGQPRLVSLKPQEALDAEGLSPGDRPDGTRVARNGCPSKGSMDIFVEPVLPRPALAVIGSSPVARALAALAAGFDFALETTDSAGTLDAEYVVVATQGRGDLDGLRAALAAPARYRAFVGSRAKFAALSATLGAQGASGAALATVRAPAGLAIDAVTPEEIALSILAEIVQHRRSGQRGA